MDKSLKEQLIKRGMYSRIAEIEKEEKNTSVWGNFKKVVSSGVTKTANVINKNVLPVIESAAGAVAVGKIETPLGTLQTKTSKEFEQAQKETLAREVQLQNQILKQVKNPNISKENKLKLLSTSIQNNPNLLSQVPEANKTAKQIIAEGFETTFNTVGLASLGGKLVLGKGVKLLANGKVAQTLKNGQTIVRALTPTERLSAGVIATSNAINKFGKAKDATVKAKVAGTLLRGMRDAGAGALFGTATAIKKGKTEAEDIGKEAGVMAGISAIAPPVLGGVIGGVIKGTGFAASKVNTLAEGFIEPLKKFAETNTKKTGNFLIDAATNQKASIGQTFAGTMAKILEKGTKALDPDWTDRRYFIKEVDQIAEELTGRQVVNTPSSAYIRTRSMENAARGKFTIAKYDYEKLNKKYEAIEPEIKGYLLGLDNLARAKAGRVVADRKTIKELEDGLDEIEKIVLAKGSSLDELEKGVTEFNEFSRKYILDENLGSGLISAEDAANMVNANPNYVHHAILDYYDDNASKFTGVSGSTQVADNLAQKSAKGSEREIAAVDIGTLHKVQQTMIQAEKNKASLAVFDKIALKPEAFGARKLSKAELVKEVDYSKDGLEKYSFYRDGVQESWLIKKDLASALKLTDAKTSGLIGNFLGFFANLTRAGATVKNLAFGITGVPRDVGTAIGSTKYGVGGLSGWLDAFDNVTNFNNPQTRKFIRGGASGSGLTMAEKPTRSVLAESRRNPVLKAISSPYAVVEALAERLESTTRKAIYDNAIKNGMKHEMAIYEAMNGTVDFNKYGNVMGVINKVIPFINARLQGVSNLGKAIKDDPTEFFRRQLFYAVYPAIYLYAHNSQYESFKNISKQTKDGSWIIMFGEEDGFTTDGSPTKIPHYIPIKKSEFQMSLANATETYFDSSSREDARGVKEFLNDQVMTTSPVSVSSLGPIVTPVEIAANYDLFRKTAIEPEYQKFGGISKERKFIDTELRMNSWTGETAKVLSKKLSQAGLGGMGLSPARIEFIVGKIFATNGKDLLKAVDMMQTGLDQTGIPNGQASTIQKISRMPILRSFIGSDASAEKIMLYEITEKIGKDKFKEEMPKELEADSILKMFKIIEEKQGAEEALKYFRGLELDKDMQQRIKRINDKNNQGQTIQRQIYDKVPSNDEKVLYLIENLKMLDTPEQRDKFLKSIEMSKEVKKKLKKELINGALNKKE